MGQGYEGCKGSRGSSENLSPLLDLILSPMSPTKKEEAATGRKQQQQQELQE